MNNKDYIIRGIDPPSKYLMHHGVKGMKWGVWNEETTDRYGGSQRRKLKLNEEGHKQNLEAIKKLTGVEKDELHFYSSTGYDSPVIQSDSDGKINKREAGYYEAIYKYISKNKKNKYYFIVSGNAKTGKIENVDKWKIY